MRAGFAKDSSEVFDEIWNFIEASSGRASTGELTISRKKLKLKFKNFLNHFDLTWSEFVDIENLYMNDPKNLEFNKYLLCQQFYFKINKFIFDSKLPKQLKIKFKSMKDLGLYENQEIHLSKHLIKTEGNCF